MKIINLENTRFIFKPNFAGNPDKDKYQDTRRKCNIIIPDATMALDMRDDGFNVKETKPREGDDPNFFEPEYYVSCICAFTYRNGDPVEHPPLVYLIPEEGAERIKMDEDTIASLDGISVDHINVLLNAREYDPINHRKSLYIRVLYVYQAIADDPFYESYMSSRKDRQNEDLPF